eukprot:6698420-Heterocapsa_arctica.AAC.1
MLGFPKRLDVRGAGRSREAALSGSGSEREHALPRLSLPKSSKVCERLPCQAAKVQDGKVVSMTFKAV